MTCRPFNIIKPHFSATCIISGESTVEKGAELQGAKAAAGTAGLLGQAGNPGKMKFLTFA